MIVNLEEKRDIKANNQQYNNRFNYAVSMRITLIFYV